MYLNPVMPCTEGIPRKFIHKINCFVILAEASIQKTIYFTKKNILFSCAKFISLIWIPASAGMTTDVESTG